jgi:hypothetical protein
MFPMDFQSLMGLGKSRYDIPSDPPKDVFAHTHEYFFIFKMIVAMCCPSLDATWLDFLRLFWNFFN